DTVPQDREILERIKKEIGLEFVPPDFGGYFLSRCLAISPALWDFGNSAPPSRVPPQGAPPANPLNRQNVVALSKIAAHVPLYGLPSGLFQITGTVEKLIATKAFAQCFLWGNQSEALADPDVGHPEADTDYTTGEPPNVRVLFSVPDTLSHPDL